MIRTKTLTLPLVSAMVASAIVPAVADVALTLSSHKAYRQNKDGATAFRGGRFDISLRDGDGIVVGNCEDVAYWPPNPLIVCSGGSTAYVLFGDLDPDVPNAGPYFWMTDVIPALIIEPRRPDLCLLKAAPASKLERPYGGFKDSSYGLYYNLHDTANVTESVISRYDNNRTYSAKQRGKFEDEIVPGVYHYSFPRLGDPVLRIPISPVIYPIAEGFERKNNQKTGVQFIANDEWYQGGFMELSYVRPNVVKWKGFSPSVVYPAVDSLYFSMRFLSDPKNPLSETTYFDEKRQESPASFFPPYVSGGDPRILLANPFVDSFTLPPVFKGGSRAVIELALERRFQTGGVTFDTSTRKFQIPVIVINRYSEYSDLRFKSNTKNIGILDDFDGDGYNNLTEWINESRAEDSSSVPKPPTPANHQAVINADGLIIDPPYYGFTVVKKQGTRPNVRQILQVSVNGGKTWKEMTTDNNWLVTETADQIRVESFTFAQPVGTLSHKYRVKVTLAK